jgi:hypothetical protein
VSIERAVFRGNDVNRGGIVSFHLTRLSCPSVSAQLCSFLRMRSPGPFFNHCSCSELESDGDGDGDAGV